MMVELSILPVNEESSISTYVAEAVKIVGESGLEYKLTPMGTVISGDWDPVMAVAKKCHDKVMSMTDRAITKIRIDDIKGENITIDSKVEKIQTIIGKES